MLRYSLSFFYLLLNLAVLIIFPERMAAQEPSSPDSVIVSPDSIRISLLTAMPGPEVFELYGHEGLRIQTPLGDNVVNYGVFDFNSPGFIPRFVKGQTDYMVIAYPYRLFLEEYVCRGSRVVEQELNLSSEQKRKLLHLLDVNLQPGNNVYRYKYLSNNCATQILDKIEEAVGEVKYPAEGPYTTWREQLADFSRNYPWYQFGIDMVLGSGLEEHTDGRQQMFMPVVLSETITKATLCNGKPLIKKSVTLYEGRGDMRLASTPWWLTPMSIFCMIALASIWLARYRWVRAGWFIIIGTVGLMIWFLILFSEHEATSPNLLAVWAGPQCFLIAWFAARKELARWQCLLTLLYALGMIIIAVMAIAGVQHLNPSIWPILITTAIMLAYMLSNYKKLIFS